MSGWIKDIINGMISGVLNTLTSASMSALNWVLNLLGDNIFHSPDMTGLPQVIYMSSRAQLAANAAMTLIVTIVGLIAMTHGTLQERHALKDLLPRMVIGFAMANLARPILRAVIGAGNAVTEALSGGTVSGQDSFNAIKRTVTDVTSNPAQFMVALILQLIIVWMLVLVVLTWLGRLSVLLVAAATGPVALMCHAIPFAEPVARIWWKTLLSCLAVQILQAVTLHMAVATLLAPGADLPALGLPHDPTGLFNLLIACFLLWMVIRIPTWVARTIGGGTNRASSVLGSIVRLIVVQQVLGATGLKGGRRPAGRRPRTSAGAGATGFRPPWPQVHHQHSAAQHHLHQHLHLHPPGTANAPGASATPAIPGRHRHPERPTAGGSSTAGRAEPTSTAAGGTTPRYRPRSVLRLEGKRSSDTRDDPVQAAVPADLNTPDRVLYGLTARQLAILAAYRRRAAG